MIFNTTLNETSFKSFFNLPEELLFAWTLINFLKCLYVTLSITSKRIPPFAVAAIFIGLTGYYIFNHAFSWLWILNLLDLSSIVYTVLTKRDGIFLLSLLSSTNYFLEPFAFIVDVFVTFFILIDLPIAVFVNKPSWSLFYVNCLVVSVALAKFNSHGHDIKLYIVNAFYTCVFLYLAWSSSNKSRLIPACTMIVAYVLGQFERKEPIEFSFTNVGALETSLLTGELLALK